MPIWSRRAVACLVLLMHMLSSATPANAGALRWHVSVRPLVHPSDVLGQVVYDISKPYLNGNRDDPGFRKATAILMVGAVLYPDSPACWLGLARVNRYLGHIDAAIDYYRFCIGLSMRPEFHRWAEMNALLELGQIYLERKNDMAAAREAFYQAVLLEPTSRRALRALRDWDRLRREQRRASQ